MRLDERMNSIITAITQEEAGLRVAKKQHDERCARLHLAELQMLYHQKETLLRRPMRGQQRAA